MFVLLQPILFAQIFLANALVSDRLSLRKSFVKTTVIFFAFITFSTEALSLLDSINSQGVVMWWLIANVGMSLYLFHTLRQRRTHISFALRRLKVTAELWSSPLQNKLFIAFITLIYTVVLLTAFSLPSTADSMTYHLARVMHWIQNEDVAFYATPILRQLYQHPLAEYSILHLQILSGGDHFANLVQYFSFVGCAVTASLIAKEFNVSRTAQLFAAVVCATTPMAILQGSSTQNDLVVSLFTMLFFYFAILVVKQRSWSASVYAGLALGLAVLAKGTALFFCFPIAALIFGTVLGRELSAGRALRLITQVTLVTVFALCVNAGHFSRNLDLFGAPITSGVDPVTNDEITLPLAASNVVRNYALHLGTFHDSTTAHIENFITDLLGSELNNPSSSYLNHNFSIPQTIHEDNAGNFIQIVLLTIACFAAFGCALEARRTVLIAAVSVIGGFLIYCLVLRWQPWASRLHLPLFMVGTSLISWFVAKLGSRGSVIVASVMFVACLPALFFGKPDALFGDRWNTDNYFVANRALRPAYAAAAEFFRKTPVTEVGLELSVDYEYYNFGDWEYPLWMLIKNKDGERPRFYHVDVKNPSGKLSGKRPPPQWVISTTDENMIDGIKYVEEFKHEPLRVLRRDLMASDKRNDRVDSRTE